MRRFLRWPPGRRKAPEGLQRSNASLFRDSRLPVEFPDAPQLLIGLTQAEGTDHFTDRNLRIVRPEDPSVFVLVITEADFIAIFFLERCSIMKLRTPRKNGVAEVQLLHQDTRRFPDLRGDFPGRLEEGSVIAPCAGDDVVAVRDGARRRVSGLGGLRRPGHHLRTLTRHFGP